MSNNSCFTINAEVARTVLTDEYAVYKTERFCTRFRELKGADTFVSKIADALILSGALKHVKPAPVSYRVRTGAHNLFFTVKERALVFFLYSTAEDLIRINDRRLVLFMAAHPAFEATVTESGLRPDENDFTKLYRVAEAEGINYPRLNSLQRGAVEAEDRSVLVQGVAGSGKTNLCIDKILYTASRNYAGKTLYTTYSRGLLLDTARRINCIKRNISELIAANEQGNVIVRGKDIKRALEYKLGVYLTNSENWIGQLRTIRDYLENKLECALISDIYGECADAEVVARDESYFVNDFVRSPANRVQGLFKRLTAFGAEIVYKEIYGYIYGKARGSEPDEESYVRERSDDFSKAEAEALFRIAKEYRSFLKEHSSSVNPLMAKELLEKGAFPEYSLIVADEVQDFTETELNLLKKASLKLFAVGDALQMINPSFFSFSYLKSLMWQEGEKNLELKHNYRSTKKIAELTEKLADLNMSLFGTHNFVIRSRIVDSNVNTSAVYVNGGAFADMLKEASLDGFTVIVGDRAEKESMRKRLPYAEILTVSEAKGLERDVVVMYNVLSGRSDKWHALEKMRLNRKTAYENSVYRYYFNLFYVGLTRAKSHLTVFESRGTEIFKSFFESQFTLADAEDAVKRMGKLLEHVETDDSELKRRAEEFMRLGQYDNAMLAADRMRDDSLRRDTMQEVKIHSDYVRTGDYRGAGIAFWEKGMYEKAREMFNLSKDYGLIEFMDACIGKGSAAPDYSIVSYFNEVTDPSAGKLITDTLANDLEAMKKIQRDTKAKLAAIRRKHG